MSYFEKWNNWNIAVKDYSPFLQFRSKTYGRKDQQAQIWEVFQKWSAQTANERQGLVIVLSGDYGTGKSAFAEELMATAHQKMMVFPIASKPTKLQENAPYKAFRSIMEQLVAYILGDSSISYWQSGLLSEIGPDGIQLLSSLVPSINLVFSELDLSRKSSAPANKIDLFRCVELFLGQFASFDNPLVICLGEIDPENGNDAEMLAYLLSSTLAYRVFFVALLSPSKSISQLQLQDSNTAHVQIPPLTLNEVVEFLDEILRPRLMEINTLASLLLQKSTGNLLFLKELVKHCEKLELINFDQNQLLWTWDLKKIESEVGLSSDVISLLSRQVESLPSKLKQYLSVAACIGLEFDVRLLSQLVEENVSQLNNSLHMAVTKGYIQPLSAIGNSFSQSLEPLNMGSQKIGSTGSIASSVNGIAPPSMDLVVQRTYKFCHRRIKEHLRNYVSRVEFQKYSLRIAQYIRKSKTDEQRLTNEQLFELLLHYENCNSIIEEDDDLLSYGTLLYDSGFQKGTSAEQHIQNFTNASNVAERISQSSTDRQILLFKIRTSLSSLYIRSSRLEKASAILSLIEPSSQDQSDSQNCHWTSLMVQLQVAKNCFEEAVDIGASSKSLIGPIFKASSYQDLEKNLKTLAEIIVNQEDIYDQPSANPAIAPYVEEMIQNCIFICKSRGDSKNAAFFFTLVLFLIIFSRTNINLLIDLGRSVLPYPRHNRKYEHLLCCCRPVLCWIPF